MASMLFISLFVSHVLFRKYKKTDQSVISHKHCNMEQSFSPFQIIISKGSSYSYEKLGLCDDFESVENFVEN